MAGIATIDMRIRVQNLHTPKEPVDASFTVSGIDDYNSPMGLIMAKTSKTIDYGLGSSVDYVMVHNVSALSTYSSGLFVFLSGQTYLSGFNIKAGRANLYSPVSGAQKFHMFVNSGGAATGGTYVRYTAFQL